MVCDGPKTLTTLSVSMHDGGLPEVSIRSKGVAVSSTGSLTTGAIYMGLHPVAVFNAPDKKGIHRGAGPGLQQGEWVVVLEG